MWIITLNYVLLLDEYNDDIKIYNELHMLIQHHTFFKIILLSLLMLVL